MMAGKSAAGSGGSSSSSSSPSTVVPRVLTSSTIDPLTRGYDDASDVFECYLLERQSYLSGLDSATTTTAAAGTNDGDDGRGDSSSTTKTEIPVRKLALGLRYRNDRPLAPRHNKHLEITLEYGPMRSVDMLDRDVVPKLVRQDAATESGGDAKKKKDDAEGQQQPNNGDSYYVSWDNQARVYYTLQISDAGGVYTNAHYLASLSGAVLKNLLQAAVNYPTHSKRRYQPFTVVRRRYDDGDDENENDNDKEEGGGDAEHEGGDNYKDDGNLVVLKSSNDVDFVEVMLEHLADVGVSLVPIILPTVWQVQLLATSIAKVPATDVRRADVARFYAKLYQCLESTITANYSAYGDTGEIPQLLSSYHPYQGMVHPQPGDDLRTGGGGRRRKLQLRNRKRRRRLDDYANANDTAPETGGAGDSSVIDSTEAASEAQQAASEAQSAAQAAEDSGNEQAAEAAQAAATAAQKAAESTNEQAALARQQALLSGDGNAAAQAVSICLSSEAYGIRNRYDSPEQPQLWNEANYANTTTVYLYWDGTFYYQVELTAPYLQVVPMDFTMPKPYVPLAEISDYDGFTASDLVDWTIAFAVLALSLIGFLLLLQQVLGRNLRVIRHLYKFQRWFFNPMHYDAGDILDDSERTARSRGGGREYTFAEDTIPLSMGGRIVNLAARHPGQNKGDAGSDILEAGDDELDNALGNPLGDMEMVPRDAAASSPPPFRKQAGSHEMYGGAGGSSQGSWVDDLDDDGFFGAGGKATGAAPQPVPARMALAAREATPPPRFLRDPDYVDMPNLSSTSKIAVPVSSGSDLGGGGGSNSNNRARISSSSSGSFD